jgi:hypothetical protein
MLKNIEIRNFGSFVDFNNSEIPFPKGNIVMHGLNGSGKSQFCLILQLLNKYHNSKSLNDEEKETLKDEIITFLMNRKSKESESANIKIKVNSYSLTFNSITKDITFDGEFPIIDVFNEQYVLDNVGDIVNLPEKEIKIGAVNKRKDEIVNKIKEDKLALKRIIKNIDTLIINTRKDTGYSTQKRTAEVINKDIYLHSTNITDSFPNAKFDLDNLSEPPELITSHNYHNFPELNFQEEEIEKINVILKNIYLEPKLTEAIYEKYININKSFYEDGVDLFQEIKTQCPFCLSKKETDDKQINELIDYIKSDYSISKKIITELIYKMEQYKQKMDNFIKRSNLNNKEILNIITTLSLRDISIEDIVIDINSLNNIIEFLQKKSKDMSDINFDFGVDNTIFDLISNFANNVNKLYQDKLEIIRIVNDRIKKISSLKRELGAKIIQNYMHKCWKQSSLRERYNELNIQISDSQDELVQINEEPTSDQTIVFFNQIIKFLGLYKYELNNNSNIILKLEDDHNINNEGYRISSGEKKFIALSYFFAEVLASVENSNELSDISILIDDPVDSSDYQKFYSFISVVENLENIIKKIFNKEDIKFCQFCILTHNALLFERLINKGKISEFILSLDNNKQTVIRKPKKTERLVTFSSYLTKICSCIIKMNELPEREIGNTIRRVLEIIASVERVSSNNICELKLNSFSKLNSLANHLSHESLERMLDPLPKSSEYIEACIELIELIRERIPNLYLTIKEKYLEDKEIDEYKENYKQEYQN